MVEAHACNAAVNMKLPLHEVEHVEMHSMICYLTEINKTAKEIHEKDDWFPVDIYSSN